MRRPSLSSVLIALSIASVAPPALAQEELPDPALTGSAAPDPAVRERDQLTTRLERLREETAATQARASALGESLIDLAGDEAKLRQELETVGARIAVLEQGIADDESALDTITADQAAIRQELAGKREELAVVLMALQRIGRSPPPALFAGEGGPRDVVRSAILLNGVIPGLDAQAQSLARSLSQAARLAADEEARWTSLRADLTAVEAERERLSALLAELERRRALSLYERDRASADLARLADEADTVEALLSRLSQGEAGATSPAADGPGFAVRRGGLTDPVAGTIVGEYGDPSATGSLAEGRTIAALPQSTVFAPMPATVLYAAPFRSFGHVLILDAGDGYHMVLTGLAESFVEAGDGVVAGAPVGRMGARAGRSAVGTVRADAGALTAARPLLYVELRLNGSAIDSHGWWRDAGPDGGRTSG